ncbi:MAG: hypothetical protein ABJB40_07515, partial [Acidobacteriota bacterium]
EEQERAEARVRMHLLKYHVDVVNVLICHIHLPEELMKTQTEKILAEQKQNMFNAQREAEVKRIELERTSSQADNQRAVECLGYSRIVGLEEGLQKTIDWWKSSRFAK